MNRSTRMVLALHLDSTDATSLGPFQTALPKLDISAKVSLSSLPGLSDYFYLGALNDSSVQLNFTSLNCQCITSTCNIGSIYFGDYF